MIIGIDASRTVIARRTGTEAYSLHLIRALLERPSEHRYRLYFNRPPADTYFPPDPRVQQRLIPFPRLWTHLRLAAELLRYPPDLLFVPSHVLPLAFRGPAVVTVHDLGYRIFPGAHPTLSRLYLDCSTRWSSRRATVILADSKATRLDLIEHYRVDPEKIRLAYPGYDPSLRPVTDPDQLAAVRQRYRLEKDYILYLGTLQPRKNLLRLIEAFASLQDDRFQLVLAGKAGWLSDPILERARAAGDGIVLPGFVADQDKAALLSGATAFVFPSLYEGFGFPVLEAMACGTPVICSNSSSLPEVAGEAALLVDPLDVGALAEAIRQLIADPALRADLVQRGRANLARFSWQSCADRVMQAIESAV